MSHVVTYAVDADTRVGFEIEPTEDWQPVGADQLAGRIHDAVEPAVRAARTVLDRLAELSPAEVTVTFGVKANGTANWVVAKAATEASFQVTMTWQPNAAPARGE
ncbi:CU044_2847 family protein [Streptomyces sp. NPDC004134]|uniref:CU044_2847 family protein n=1 Tax=Streptomyces sp. NPDC004134 TaxID=3364691 RepID=UPI0036C03EF2